MFYANPSTFMDVLLSASRYLEEARESEMTTKQDVIDSMESRVSVMMGKLASVPTTTSFCIFRESQP